MTELLGNSEILSCPFCNGEASLSSGYIGWNTVGYDVECLECGASSYMNPDKQETINCWNQRANDEKLTRCLRFLAFVAVPINKGCDWREEAQELLKEVGE